jgi:UDP-arabinose 4-epimerase
MTPVLVTGGAGFIGSHTCKALRASGFDPVSYDSLDRGNPEAVQWGALEIGTLADGVRLREVLTRYRPAAVVHFAALAYVGESNADPLLYYRNNVGGTAVLLDAMRDCGVGKMVLSSSCAVYGAPAVVPIGEDARLAPVNAYGATKLFCEQILKDCAAAYALNFITLRYFNAAGADPGGDIGECHMPETHAIPLLLDAAAGGRQFTIFGDDYPTPDGTCVRDYVHVTDLADAHVRALRALLDGADNSALNLGTGRGWSVRELIAAVREVTGRDVAVQSGPRRPGDPPALVADPARAREMLGWRPDYCELATQVSHAWTWRQGGAKAWKRMRASETTGN